jgi:hypothetical protein
MLPYSVRRIARGLLLGLDVIGNGRTLLASVVSLNLLHGSFVRDNLMEILLLTGSRNEINDDEDQSKEENIFGDHSLYFF